MKARDFIVMFGEKWAINITVEPEREIKKQAERLAVFKDLIMCQ